MHIDDLKARSIRIPRGGINTYNPYHATYRTVNMGATAQNYDECYSYNNSTICFCTDGEIFVTPFTIEVESTLRDAGFAEASFYVPFSNGEHPVGELEKVWSDLRRQAENERLATA